jgi:hypothetical protein
MQTKRGCGRPRKSKTIKTLSCSTIERDTITTAVINAINEFFPIVTLNSNMRLELEHKLNKALNLHPKFKYKDSKSS